MYEKWSSKITFASLWMLFFSQTGFFGSWSEAAFVLALLLGFVLPGSVDIYRTKRWEKALLMIGFIAFAWGLGLFLERPHLILDQRAKLPLLSVAVVSLVLYVILEPIISWRRTTTRR